MWVFGDQTAKTEERCWWADRCRSGLVHCWPRLVRLATAPGGLSRAWAPVWATPGAGLARLGVARRSSRSRLVSTWLASTQAPTEHGARKGDSREGEGFPCAGSGYFWLDQAG